MMSHFMSYQLVILNGEKRGERLTVGRAPVTIGRNSSCDICLPDPDIGELHAKITPRAEELQICVTEESNRLLINKSEVHESPLKHGDVIEIGHTRLFVQSYINTGTWEGLAGFRKWRKWLTIGLPILILIAITLTIKRCSHESDPSPAPNAANRLNRPSVNYNTNNTDWTVTNIPTILINPTVILTSSPPEIIEAEDILIQLRTNDLQREIELSQNEMEFATRFFAAASTQNQEEQTIPDNTVSKDIIQQAEESLGAITTTPSQPVTTNSFLNAGSIETSTNQADTLQN